ncbi:hypothetical protein FRC12_005202 [Ceratobasidium sp. 428]|nr:hypothetical protein FRC12_005202 [Ceratobasidium sp. 428]
MAPINDSALSALRSELSPQATISFPGDATYTTKRWARNAEKPAAVIICPATSEDIVQILAFVQGKGAYSAQEKLDFAVKSGGHSPSGASSLEGGLVIDLQPNMHGVRIDPDDKLAYVKGGSVWGEVDEASIQYSLAAVAGTVNHTGVGGSATVVTASGDILTASDCENQELFWAIRGGGGNFGVVTEFVYRLHEQRPDVYTATLIYPGALVEPLFNELNAWMKERTILENVLVVFAIGPGDQPVMIVQLVYNGDSEEGARKFERFVKLGPFVNQAETLPYVKLNGMMNHHAPPGENRLFRGNFIPETPNGVPVSLAAGLLNSLVDMVNKHPAAKKSMAFVELYHPAKLASVASNATAYPHRDPSFNVLFITNWSEDSFSGKVPDNLRAWDRVFMDLRSEHFAPELIAQGGYTNYLDEDSQMASNGVANRRFGSNFPRLAEAKRKYDPNNLFSKWFPIMAAPTA